MTLSHKVTKWDTLQFISHNLSASIASSLKYGKGNFFSFFSPGQDQLEEMAEMLSPPEREALARVTARLTGLHTAHAQVTEDLFLYSLFLQSQRK